MSVVFGTPAPYERPLPPRREPCYCAQDARCWAEAMNDPGHLDLPAIKRQLAKSAEPGCAFCDGCGIETVPTLDPFWFETSSRNGRTLLRAMKIPAMTEDGLTGECTIHVGRRGVILARNTDLRRYERTAVMQYRGPLFREDGMLDLKPVRGVGGSLKVEQLEYLVDKFSRLVEEAARRGAETVCWG